MESRAMAELEAMLGHRFRRPELLQQALTHSSFAHEGGQRVQPAMHLHGGSEAARNFVLRRVVEPELEQLKGTGDEEFAVTDFKSALQESVQALGRPQPAYSVAKESGPDHKKIFTVELRLQEGNGDRSADYVARAEGPSKKIAEQRAAKLALEHLQGAAQITGNSL